MNTLKELETLKVELIANGSPKYVISHLERIMSYLEPTSDPLRFWFGEPVADLDKPTGIQCSLDGDYAEYSLREPLTPPTKENEIE